MLSKADNDLLTQVGPNTPMGDLMRRYWIPVLMSTELPVPDGPPLRVKLLGENLVAFRDTSGAVGLLAENCPHRGASLFFGRNEEAGLRCVYHGWKFDVAGRCTDMPNEPPESNFKHKIRHIAYPCTERSGVIWTYMGPAPDLPPFPELEWAVLPEEHHQKWLNLRECNWMQALEGDLDSAHTSFLHSALSKNDFSDNPTYRYRHLDRAPHLDVVATDGGVMYGARRNFDEDQYYWRISQFIMPFHTMIPPRRRPTLSTHMYVPLDDEHTMVWNVNWNPAKPFSAADRTADPNTLSGGLPPGGFLPNTSDPLGRWRLAGNKRNEYFLDYEAQQTERYSGIPGNNLQDGAMVESMGLVCDRTREHLGTTDAMIIQVRRRLIAAAKSLRATGTLPPGVENPEVYRVRSASLILPQSANWVDWARDSLTALTGAPVAVAGGT